MHGWGRTARRNSGRSARCRHGRGRGGEPGPRRGERADGLTCVGLKGRELVISQPDASCQLCCCWEAWARCICMGGRQRRGLCARSRPLDHLFDGLDQGAFHFEDMPLVKSAFLRYSDVSVRRKWCKLKHWFKGLRILENSPRKMKLLYVRWLIWDVDFWCYDFQQRSGFRSMYAMSNIDLGCGRQMKGSRGNTPLGPVW